MPLEAGDGFISGLVATNPVNATDQVAQGDDHLRLIKTALLGTFPNITGAVTPTQTELNYAAGVTSAIQTQIDGKAATAHNHSAADLTSGTVPDARFPATLPAASGVNLTALNGTNVASGTVADARLSAQVVLKDAAITSVDNGDAADPGYRGVPQNAQSDNYTLVLADAGKMIYQTGASKTVTIPARASVNYPLGTIITIYNRSGGNMTLAITTDVLSWSPGLGTGSRTIANGGYVTIQKTIDGGGGGTEWLLMGTGIS